MIYEDENEVYYLKKGGEYEVAIIEIKYSRTKRKNVITVTGSGEYVAFTEDEEKTLKEYTFKELEKKIVG